MANTDWYKNTIVYGIDIIRFYDANGDGNGDIQGVTAKLDYLQWLGIGCLWLLPFFPSNRHDNGYDVTEFTNVDSELGTLADFKALVREAHARNIRIIIDLPIHHTSDKHPWFMAAMSDRQSPFHDFYVWSDDPPEDPADKSIFPGEEDGVWQYCEEIDRYYHHKFYFFEPDLNIANARVWNEIKNIFSFWLAFDIDGFRIDAATHMFEEKGIPGTGVDSGPYLQELRELVDGHKKDVLLLGEADVEPHKICIYFGDGNRLDMLLNFLMNNKLFLALARQQAGPIVDCLRHLSDISQPSQWLNFVRNLDEIDLEQLNEDERQEVFQVFAPESKMRIYDRGIRRSLPSMLQDMQRIKMVYSLLFSLPGVPMFTYGAEIGMGDDLLRNGRSAVRLPMQWSAGHAAGFSRAMHSSVINQIVQNGPYNYKKINVAKQRKDQDSLLYFFRRLISLRKQYPSICESYPLIDTQNPALLKLSYEDLMTIHNLSDKEQRLNLSGSTGKVIFGSDIFHSRNLPPYGYAWVEQKKA